MLSVAVVYISAAVGAAAAGWAAWRLMMLLVPGVTATATRIRAFTKYRRELESAPESLRRFQRRSLPAIRARIATLDELIRRLGMPSLVYATVIGGFGLFMIGAMAAFFRSLPIGVVGGAAALTLVHGMRYRRRTSQRRLVDEMLPAVAAEMSLELQDHGDPLRALGTAARNARPPVRGPLEKAANRLLQGQHHERVLDALADDLATPHARMTVQVLRTAWLDKSAARMLRDLTFDLGRHLEEAKEFNHRLGSPRFQTSLLLGGIGFVTVGLPRMIPGLDFWAFIRFDPMGRMAAMLVFLTILLGAVFDRLVSALES